MISTYQTRKCQIYANIDNVLVFPNKKAFVLDKGAMGRCKIEVGKGTKFSRPKSAARCNR